MEANPDLDALVHAQWTAILVGVLCGHGALTGWVLDDAEMSAMLNAFLDAMVVCGAAEKIGDRYAVRWIVDQNGTPIPLEVLEQHLYDFYRDLWCGRRQGMGMN